jgi:hypothetical protein
VKMHVMKILYMTSIYGLVMETKIIIKKIYIGFWKNRCKNHFTVT